MKPPRFTIITLMCLVGMVAVSLAVGRALYASDPWLPAGVCLAGLAIELGLFRIVRTRGKSRAFWAGFVICGLLAVGSFAWGVVVKSSISPSLNVSTGEITTLPITVLQRVGLSSWSVWRSYLLLAVLCLNRLPFGSALMSPDFKDPIVLATAALMAGLPQLLIALAGGLLARRFFPRPRAITS
jgi:hypothetical protein